jgi:hypothetical protein
MPFTHLHYPRNDYSLTRYERDTRRNVMQSVHILCLSKHCTLSTGWLFCLRARQKLLEIIVHNTPLHNNHILQTSPTHSENSRSFQEVGFCSMLIKSFQIINEFQLQPLFFLCKLFVVTRNTRCNKHPKSH